MNSLKGLGVCVVLAAMVFAMRELAHAHQVMLVATIAIIVTSAAAYVASKQRYRKDRRIAGE